MQKEYICCFTGHREVQKRHMKLLPSALDALLEDLYNKGVRTFRAGGALGFDTVAALSVLRLREKHPDARLELCLPCKDQDKKWSFYSKMIYEKILRQSDEVKYVGEKYTSGCMFARNRMMVDGAHVCVAYYDGGSGGTGYTVSYAGKKGVKVINTYKMLENKE